MLEPWNNSTLLPPPINMFLSKNKVDVGALRHTCNNIIRILSKQSPLHNESAICSRFIYKYDKKFRHDIGYRSLRKVNAALKKYLTLNLLKDVDSFLSALPSQSDDDIYLPTKQMLEYVLVRIMAFSKIMIRICVCSKQAAIFYLDRTKRGEAHWMSLLPYALLSRLWSMCMVLLQHSCSWYSNLHSHLSKLQLKGLNFLPDNYELPSDLEQWLELKTIDDFGRFEWAHKININIDTSLIDDDENDMLDNILGYVNQTSEVDEMEPEDIKAVLGKFKQSEPNQFPVSTVTQVDQGEVLSRESFKVLLNNQNNTNNKQNMLTVLTPIKRAKVGLDKPSTRETVTKHGTETELIQKSNKHSHNSVIDAKSLKKFIDQEEEFRNQSDNKSLTRHLSFMQWQALRKTLLKLCDAITNKKIQRKFGKIWKEKCIDCI